MLTHPTLLDVVACLVDVLDIDDRDALAAYLLTAPAPAALTQRKPSANIFFTAAHDLDELANQATDDPPYPRLRPMPDTLTDAWALLEAAADALAAAGTDADDPFEAAAAHRKVLTALAHLQAAGDVSDDLDSGAGDDLGSAGLVDADVLTLLTRAYELITNHPTIHTSPQLRETALTVRELLAALPSDNPDSTP